MSSDPIAYCLDHVTDYAAFERLCHELMSLEGYPSIEPLGGCHDRGRDAIDINRADGFITIFCYSVRDDWFRKLKQDAMTIHRHKHECDRLVYLSTFDFNSKQRDEARTFIKKTYGWGLECFGRERLRLLLATRHKSLIAAHPQLFDPRFFNTHGVPHTIGTPHEVIPWQRNLPPRRFDRLIGRDQEVQRLKALLTAPRSRPMSLISGIGGVGKTALAFEVAQRCMGERLFDGLVWVTARLHEFIGIQVVHREEATSNFDAVLGSVCRQLGVDEPADSKGRQRLIRTKLQQSPHLVVLDNLEDIDQQEAWIQHVEGLLGVSRALLTSRVLHPSMTNVDHVQLEGLPFDACVDFLRTESQRRGGAAAALSEASPDLMRRIHDTTGGMPLALLLLLGQVMLGFVIEDVVSALRSAHSSQEDFYRFIYFNSWRRLSEAAQRILITTATFDGSVGRHMLQSASDVPNAEFSAAVAQLVQGSLLEGTAQSESDKMRYDVHPLTRSFVRSDLRERWKQQKALLPKS